MTTLRQELDAELNSLEFLPVPVRAAIRVWASSEENGREEDVRGFLTTHLPRLRRFEEAVRSSELQKLASYLDGIDDPSVVVRSLGGLQAMEWLSSDYIDSGVWCRLRQIQTDPIRVIYCYLSEFALVYIEHGPGPMREVASFEIESLLLENQGRLDEMIHLVGEFYRLPLPPWDRTCCDRVVVEFVSPPWNPLTLLPLIRAAGILSRIGRNSEAIEIVEAILSLNASSRVGEAVDRLTPEGLADWLNERLSTFETLFKEALLTQVDSADFDADSAEVDVDSTDFDADSDEADSADFDADSDEVDSADFDADSDEVDVDSDEESQLVIPRELCKLVSLCVRRLAWGWSASGHRLRALRLLGAFLGLFPLPLTTLSVLEMRRRLLGDAPLFDNLIAWGKELIEQDCLEAALVEFRPLLSEVTEGCPVVWQGSQADCLALLVAALGKALCDRDRFDTVIETVIPLTGLSLALLRDRQLLDSQPLGLHSVEPPLATLVITYFGTALLRLGNDRAVVNLIEAVWQINPECDHEPWQLRERLTRAWVGTQPNTQERQSLVVYILSLFRQGRTIAAAVVVQSIAPEIISRDPTSFAELQTALAEYELTGRNEFLNLICRVVTAIDAAQGATILLESFQLSEESLQDPAHICRYLQQQQELLGIIVYFERLHLLMSSLDASKYINQNLNALISVGELIVGVPGAWGSSPCGLRVDDTSHPIVRYFHILFANALVAGYTFQGRFDRAWSVLSEVYGLNFHHLGRSGGLRECLRGLALPEGAVEEQWGGFFLAVLRTLSHESRKDELEALYASQVAPLDWLDPFDCAHAPMVAAELAECVMLVYGGHHPELVFPLASRYLHYFRHQLLHSGISPADRRLLLARTAEFRRELIRQGTSALARGEYGDQGWLRLLLLDQEFGQRWLLERLLLAGPSLSQTEPVIAGEWPLSEPPPTTETLEHVSAAGVARFEQISIPFERPYRAESTQLPQSARRTPLEGLLREGLDESTLADMLGETELFLRASFSAEGNLLWAIFERYQPDLSDLSIPPRLRTVASDGGRHDTGQRDRITTAVERHDEAIEEAWERHRAWIALRGEAGERFAQAVNWLAGDDQYDAFTDFIGDRQAFERQFPRTYKKIYDNISIRHILDRSAQSDLLVDSAWSMFASVWCLDVRSVQRTLDLATHSFFDEVGKIWNLDTLADYITPSHDLIVQLDDVLHGVPPAFLKVGEQYLVEMVRSVRSGFGLLQNEYLRDIEREVLNEQEESFGEREPRRIVSLSWFDQTDKISQHAAAFLHRGFRETVRLDTLKRLGYIWAGAAVSPVGGVETLAGLMATGGPIQVAAVCGHGTRQTPPGIMLADGLWTGSERIHNPTGSGGCPVAEAACDLGQVELLLLVSCLVGRPAHTLVRGVEGFCVELTASRARSVVAGLWSLHCHDAVAFAAEVANRYLELREQERARHPEPVWLLSARLRGLAVADIQRRWLAESREEACPPPRLNTAAGLVLFNLA
jgi:hypothetical protein